MAAASPAVQARHFCEKAWSKIVQMVVAARFVFPPREPRVDNSFCNLNTKDVESIQRQVRFVLFFFSPLLFIFCGPHACAIVAVYIFRIGCF